MRERSSIQAVLTELAIMILVFSLCASVCLSIFMSARSASRRSAELTNAASWVSSAAQSYKAADGDCEKAALSLGAEATADGFSLYFNKEWASADEPYAEYILTLEAFEDGRAYAAMRGPDGEIFGADVEAVQYG